MCICTTVWGSAASQKVRAYGYRQSAKETLLNHLIKCEYQTEDVKLRAANENRTKSPGRHHPYSQPDGSASHPRLPQLVFHSSNPIASGSQSSGHSEFPPVPGNSGYQPLPELSRPPTPYIMSPLSGLPSGIGHPSPLLFHPGTMGSPAAAFSPVVQSRASTPFESNLSAGRRSSRSLRSTTPYSVAPWDAASQQGFENRLARLTASAGLPLSWVDNPEWIGFVEEYVPHAQPFDRKALTNRIIPQLVASLRTKVRSEATGKFATIQADGWTGLNHRHLIAFMITADGKVFPIFLFSYKNTHNLFLTS